MADLKTCECPGRWVLVEGMEVLTKKCAHCVEVEKVARELAKWAFTLAGDTVNTGKIYDRARACGLLED